MNWISSINKTRVYHYKGTDESQISGPLDEMSEVIGVALEGDPGEQFEHDGVTYTRSGFEPVTLGLATKVVFEKNGRKAYKVGNTYTSATKENYMRTGETSTVLSNSYKKHMNSKIDAQMDYLAKDQKRFEKSKTKGSVSFAGAKKSTKMD